MATPQDHAATTAPIEEKAIPAAAPLEEKSKTKRKPDIEPEVSDDDDEVKLSDDDDAVEPIVDDDSKADAEITKKVKPKKQLFHKVFETKGTKRRKVNGKETGPKEIKEQVFEDPGMTILSKEIYTDGTWKVFFDKKKTNEDGSVAVQRVSVNVNPDKRKDRQRRHKIESELKVCPPCMIISMILQCLGHAHGMFHGTDHCLSDV